MRAPVDKRFQKRIPYAFKAEGRSRSGLVLNVSRGGLFLQTSVPEGAGAVVDLELNPLDRAEPIALSARVVWKRAVPAQLRTMASGGLGMQIIWAAEAYYGLLSGLVETRGKARSEPPGARQRQAGSD